MAQRVGRVIALLFHDHGNRRRGVVSSTTRPYFTPGKDMVPILQEAGLASGPVWTDGKSRPYRDYLTFILRPLNIFSCEINLKYKHTKDIYFILMHLFITYLSLSAITCSILILNSAKWWNMNCKNNSCKLFLLLHSNMYITYLNRNLTFTIKFRAMERQSKILLP